MWPSEVWSHSYELNCIYETFDRKRKQGTCIQLRFSSLSKCWHFEYSESSQECGLFIWVSPAHNNTCSFAMPRALVHWYMNLKWNWRNHRTFKRVVSNVATCQTECHVLLFGIVSFSEFIILLYVACISGVDSPMEKETFTPSSLEVTEKWLIPRINLHQERERKESRSKTFPWH